MQHFFTILNSFYLEAPDSKVTREDEKKKFIIPCMNLCKYAYTYLGSEFPMPH